MGLWKARVGKAQQHTSPQPPPPPSPLMAVTPKPPPPPIESPPVFTPNILSSENKRRFGSFFAKSSKSKAAAPPSVPSPQPKARPPFEFEGKGVEEVQLLLRNVWRFAHSRGREEDNRWKAQLAGVCMTGKASEWYQTLDPKTQSDWELLRNALQVRFPNVRDNSDSIDTPASPPPLSLATLLSSSDDVSLLGSRRWSSHISSPILPVPPSVPSAFRASQVTTTSIAPGPSPSTSTPAAPPTRVSVSLAPCDGRIRVIPDGITPAAAAATKGPYIAQAIVESGWHITSPTACGSLHVQFDPSTSPHDLRLSNSQNSWLGLHWVRDDGHGTAETPSEASLVVIAPSTDDPASLVSSGIGTFHGSHCTSIWDIYPDGTIGVFCVDDRGGLHRLEVALCTRQEDIVPAAAIPAALTPTPASTDPLLVPPALNMPLPTATVADPVAASGPAPSAGQPLVPETPARPEVKRTSDPDVRAICLVKDFDNFVSSPNRDPSETFSKARLLFEPV